MAFGGIPASAIAFYRDLDDGNNTREWWQAHKATYERDVREPMTALVTALAPDFGELHVFRPNRDVRFSNDKSPYKSHQGAYCGSEAGAWYVHLDGDGFFAGGGAYRMARDQLARYRRAVQTDLPGERLDRLLTGLRDAGYEVGGEQLATRPRGVPKDHPRVDLLRYTSLHVRRDWGEPEWLSTPACLDEVRACWDGIRPLVAWLDEHVGASDEPRGR